MCLIMIGKLEHIKKLDLAKAWATNPHGAGIVIPSDTPDMIKGIMHYKQFDSLLGKLSDKLTVAIHLRLATHGKISPQNTHPFQLNKGSYLMHNGVLQGLGSPGEKGISDTAHLAKILQRVAKEDRSALLDSLPGKYALIEGNTIDAIGYFDELPGNVEVSNTYWMPRVSVMPGSFNASLEADPRASVDYDGSWFKGHRTAWEND